MDVRPGSPLEILYEEQATPLWHSILAYAGDPTVASDSVAEAFAQCASRMGSLRSPKAWVWSTAFKIAAGELKRRNATVPLVDVHTYEMPERAWEVVDALRALPERQRAVLILYYYAGYPTKDISRMLGSTSATVRVHLSQGRKRLRQVLEGDEDA